MLQFLGKTPEGFDVLSVQRRVHPVSVRDGKQQQRRLGKSAAW